MWLKYLFSTLISFFHLVTKIVVWKEYHLKNFTIDKDNAGIFFLIKIPYFTLSFTTFGKSFFDKTKFLPLSVNLKSLNKTFFTWELPLREKCPNTELLYIVRPSFLKRSPEKNKYFHIWCFSFGLNNQRTCYSLHNWHVMR